MIASRRGMTRVLPLNGVVIAAVVGVCTAGQEFEPLQVFVSNHLSIGEVGAWIVTCPLYAVLCLLLGFTISYAQYYLMIRQAYREINS